MLQVPPLRARLEDLPLLIDALRRRLNARRGLALEGVTPDAPRRLAAYPWPGNVRELEAVVKEAMLRRGRGWVEPDDFALDDTDLDDGTAAVRSPPARASATVAAPHEAASRREVALELAVRHGAVTRGQLAAACGVSGELARQDLVALVGLGRLRRVGGSRATRYVPVTDERNRSRKGSHAMRPDPPSPSRPGRRTPHARFPRGGPDPATGCAAQYVTLVRGDPDDAFLKGRTFGPRQLEGIAVLESCEAHRRQEF